MNFIRRFFSSAVSGIREAWQPKDRAPMKIRDGLLTAMGASVELETYVLPTVAPRVIPAPAKLACDSLMEANYSYASSQISEGLGFMGYTYLAELTQRPEYRKASEIVAKEMTRKWIKLQCSGEEDKADKIKAIEAEFKRLNVQEVFCKVIEHDGFFGRGQIYIDTGATDKPQELKTPLSDSAGKIGKGMLKRIGVVEAMWTYPNQYNALDPLAADYYKPSSWFVMGKEVHASRLMFFISRQVPDMLKPAYAFGGLSLTQIMKPYVDNWLRTRQSVSDLLHSFSTMVLKTNLSGVLTGGGGDDMVRRAELFNKSRDNKGLMLLDKDTEDLTNVSAPIASLDKLQAQAQEQMASIAGIPLIILLKITPGGLNASSDGEIRTFYDWIEAQQEALCTPQLSRLLNIVQLSLFGDIDDEIGFKWEPLWTLDKGEAAMARKTETDSDVALIDAGVLSPLEVRTRLAGEEDSPYMGLDVDDVPEPPEPEVAPGENDEGE